MPIVVDHFPSNMNYLQGKMPIKKLQIINKKRKKYGF